MRKSAKLSILAFVFSFTSCGPPAAEIATTMVAATAEFESAVAVALQQTQTAKSTQASKPTETPIATHAAIHTAQPTQTATDVPTLTDTATAAPAVTPDEVENKPTSGVDTMDDTPTVTHSSTPTGVVAENPPVHCRDLFPDAVEVPARHYLDNLEESWFRVLENNDTYFYVDPPYWKTENYYSLHEFDRDDHKKLCDQLKNIQGKFSLKTAIFLGSLLSGLAALIYTVIKIGD